MKGYRDWASQKHARPTLTKDSLMKCSDNLYDAISFWERKAFDPKLLNACRILAESLRSYANYLVSANERAKTVRKTETLDAYTRETYEMPIEAVDPKMLKVDYKLLDSFMEDKDIYFPVAIDNDIFELNISDDRKLRYRWFGNLQLSCRWGL